MKKHDIFSSYFSFSKENVSLFSKRSQHVLTLVALIFQAASSASGASVFLSLWDSYILSPSSLFVLRAYIFFLNRYKSYSRPNASRKFLLKSECNAAEIAKLGQSLDLLSLNPNTKPRSGRDAKAATKTRIPNVALFMSYCTQMPYLEVIC